MCLLIVEERKTLEGFRKEYEGVIKKSKTIETHVKSALQDLQAFQLKKQHRLNELDTVVVLKMHQLYYCNDGRNLQNISSCLVFPACTRASLSHRIGELIKEKHQEKQLFR